MTELTKEQAAEIVNDVFSRGYEAFFVTYLGCWKRQDPQDAQMTAMVSGGLVTALVAVATRVAFDLDMPPEALHGMINDYLDAADRGAPRWG